MMLAKNVKLRIWARLGFEEDLDFENDLDESGLQRFCFCRWWWFEFEEDLGFKDDCFLGILFYVEEDYGY